MADEVDTLMHIRGSLQTTEGIDIVLEAGKLAELYNQASTLARIMTRPAPAVCPLYSVSVAKLMRARPL